MSIAAENIGRSPRNFGLSDVECELVEHMLAMCEWRLGRRSAPVDDDSGSEIPQDQALTTDEIKLCIKRLIKSVKTWNKVGGSQGYRNFIIQFTV